MAGGSTLKAVVLGAGNIGGVIARDFASGVPSWEVTSADIDISRAKEVVSRYRGKNLTPGRLDVGKKEEMVSFLRGFDLVVGALPGSAGFAAARACIEAGKDMVDVSFSPEDPFLLKDELSRKGILMVPDCGVAPGLSNILVGRAVSRLDAVESVHVMVGGLPVKPVPPLGYVITWSVEGLIDEYTRRARIIEDGVGQEVEALTGVETIDFPGVGPLEAFYTDGARTLFQTVGPVKSMWEKTLRYPGHVGAVKMMRDIGLFDSKPLDLGGAKVAPRQVAAKILEGLLRIPGAEDLLAMSVVVEGVSGSGKRARMSYSLLDYFERSTGTTAMARTTAYTTSVVAQLVAKGFIKEKGLVTPEELGMDTKIYDRLLLDLKGHGLNVIADE
jgi:saccharopine dehydrogenase-like NADP-dependent oxidoreductase